MPLKSIDKSTTVFGYRLVERIGSGGYGEVWSAEAPGGIAKAVKFIYGYHDDNRAQRELTSLNRIKQVRHPFLLSLERIDVLEGQLVVITELADMSVKDRYDQCRESGLPGIPRKELLGYMQDAADALDFLSESHSLQHLDVKPENLLLVSGHVKVADFGLVKDIHDGTQSLMGGLTPAFAPPELFDGRPSQTSDQYSLAIVFQEMLTGKRPFDGKTAAQLASQHLKEKPQMSSLSPADQAVLTRALAKDPTLRYPNCRVMIDELDRQREQPARVSRSRKRYETTNPAKARHDFNGQTKELTNPLGLVEAEIDRHARVEVTNRIVVRPTLFLGVGQTGTEIARRLRKRFQERVGTREHIPAIRMLCLDTDQRGLAAASRGELALANDETLAIPLRRPEEYRADSKMHLSWLSRRWIYNVPRSLQTERIRPLGRLAFADHHAAIFQRLRQLLSEITSVENLARTAETLSGEISQGPRIVIAGSCAGGVGSGMMIDLAYAIRTIALEIDLNQESILAILAHATDGDSAGRGLNIANTLALLNETFHFSCVEPFPGDTTCGLAPLEQEPFDWTYLLSLGSDLSRAEFAQRADDIAEYLFLDTMSTCGEFFAHCRQTEPEVERFRLRSFGLHQTHYTDHGLLPRLGEVLGSRVLKRWLSLHEVSDADIDQFANTMLQALGADLETQTKLFQDLVNQEFGCNPATMLVNSVNSLGLIPPRLSEEIIASARSQADRLFGHPLTSAAGLLENRFADLLDEAAPARADQLRAAILQAVDEPCCRIGGATALLEGCRRRLKQSLESLEAVRKETLQRMAERHDPLGEEVDPRDPDAVPSPRRDSAAWIRDFADHRAQEVMLRLSIRGLKQIEHHLSEAEPLLRNFRDKVGLVESGLRNLFAGSGNGAEGNESPPLLTEAIESQLTQQMAHLVQNVDQAMQLGYFHQQGGLSQLANDEFDFRELVQPLNASIVRSLQGALREVDFDKLLTLLKPSQKSRLIEELFRYSETELQSCGGIHHLLAAIPELTSPDNIAPPLAALNQNTPPTVVQATLGELVVCHELDRIPLATIVMRLLKDSPQCVEYAMRLHARNDVRWCAITDLR